MSRERCEQLTALTIFHSTGLPSHGYQLSVVQTVQHSTDFSSVSSITRTKRDLVGELDERGSSINTLRYVYEFKRQAW